jgi:demethylmenaquinone methyltransferase/2-methoxy-6-polyprenyl-1,4-benzoquinol methylase
MNGLRKLPKWLKKHERGKMADSQVDQTGTAYFGFRRFKTETKIGAVQAHFSRVAPKYDFMNSVLSFGIHHAWKRQAVRMLGLKMGDYILDVCGGTGDLAVLSAVRIGKSGKVVLYDINEMMMQAGRKRSQNIKLSDGIQYVLGDAEKIACRDDRFDAAMVGFGIRNLTHLKKGFQEMHRVLKPGGRIMCLEFSRPVNRLFCWLYDLYSFRIMPAVGQLLAGSSQSYACLSETIRMFATPEELTAILEEVGFEAVTFKRFTNGIAVVHVGTKPK